jgi:hypothetical protein
MTRFIVIFGLIVTVGLSVLPSDSHAQVSPALARKAPDAAEIMDCQ